jgi:hypothetical protein
MRTSGCMAIICGRSGLMASRFVELCSLISGWSTCWRLSIIKPAKYFAKRPLTTHRSLNLIQPQFEFRLKRFSRLENSQPRVDPPFGECE